MRNKRDSRRGAAMALAGALWALAGAAGAQSTTPATASSAEDAVPSAQDLASVQCPSGKEQFVPGDYFYCLATHTYGQGRYADSQRFFRTAAGWASKPAQYVLGVMALHGDHQPVDRPLALAWLALASERPGSKFREAYDTAYHGASASERKRANELLASMRPTYADATAAVRAEQRYTSSMKRLATLSARGAKYCMAGASKLSGVDGGAVDPTQCPPVESTIQVIDAAASELFEGWTGHVQVGAVEQAGPATGKPD